MPSHDIPGWMQALARIGYVARGVIYLGIGYLAARASLGAGTPRGAGGTLREFMANGGRWVILALAIGLAAHAVWRFVAAARDPECPPGKQRRLLRAMYVLSGFINASLAFTALKLFNGSRSGDNREGEQEVAAMLFSQPLGRWLVALVGVAVVCYAAQQAYAAIKASFAKYIHVSDAGIRKFVIAIGRAGIASRAVVLVLLGYFFIQAARTYDPDAAGGTEKALQWLGHGWMLRVVAVGVIAFGLLQLAYARYRRLAPAS